MTSIAAHTGTVGVGPYSASKAALIGLMRCLALEVAKRGIRVNSLSPGLVDTPLVNKIRAWLDEKDKMYPLGIGRPEDVAYATVYFLSDASRKITGTSFNLDGGIPFT
jgi:NAD(P)-dependent dehydrogenase (short-subunit alcohol dehydrogenase family)